MKLKRILEEFNSADEEIKNKAKEIKKYTDAAFSYFEDVDAEDFTNEERRIFDKGMDELDNARYEISVLIDVLL